MKVMKEEPNENIRTENIRRKIKNSTDDLNIILYTDRKKLVN